MPRAKDASGATFESEPRRQLRICRGPGERRGAERKGSKEAEGGGCTTYYYILLLAQVVRK